MPIDVLSVTHLPSAGVPTAHGPAGLPWRALVTVSDGRCAVQAEAVALEAFGTDRKAALAHAVGWAALDLEARRQDRSLAAHLAALLGRANGQDAIETSALLGGADDATVVRAARAARMAGYGTFKVKVGASGDASRSSAAIVADTVARVGAVLEVLPKDGRLRLDANQAWTLEQMAAVTRALMPWQDRIAWLEDPCVPGTSGQAMLDASPIDLAPDERCQDPDALDAWLVHPRTAALVIKPGLWGPTRALELARLALHHGLPVAASSAYEGPAGLAVVAAFAAAAGRPGMAHGLLDGPRSVGPRITPPRGLPTVTPCVT
ncbi:MAG: hypothetical protein FJY99_10945 [Candidatus Sericytochromatia bacterium]|nr:hypothetical protein [Candidatus Tanganyikabacteria bacterium]